MITMNIYFQDLSEQMQQRILRVFGDNCNWDVIPMHMLEIEDDRDVTLDSFQGDENVPEPSAKEKYECVLSIPYKDTDEEMAAVTREGKNDYTVYFTKSDCSVRGTLRDVIREITKKTMDYETIKKIQELIWKDDDLMRQETLFELQEVMAEFALDIARREERCEDLEKAFPWLYRKVEKGGN